MGSSVCCWMMCSSKFCSQEKDSNVVLPGVLEVVVSATSTLRCALVHSILSSNKNRRFGCMLDLRQCNATVCCYWNQNEAVSPVFVCASSHSFSVLCLFGVISELEQNHFRTCKVLSKIHRTDQGFLFVQKTLLERDLYPRRSLDSQLLQQNIISYSKTVWQLLAQKNPEKRKRSRQKNSLSVPKQGPSRKFQFIIYM